MRFGFVVERSGVHWDERFWMDMPSVGVRGFGDDSRARVFLTAEDAKKAIREIDKEFGYYCYITKLTDLYPPPL